MTRGRHHRHFHLKLQLRFVAMEKLIPGYAKKGFMFRNALHMRKYWAAERGKV